MFIQNSVMKNIFTLSVLTIVVLLSSCKGNSFSTRRYTHFSKHQKPVTVNETKVVKIETKTTFAETLAVTPVVKQKTTSNVKPSLTASSATKPVSKSLPFKPAYASRPLQISQALVNSSPHKDLSNSSLIVKQQRANTLALHVFKGVVGDILSIVLYVVFLCILVAAIIILVIVL